MNIRPEVVEFVNLQKSLHLYEKAKKAFIKVLSSMPKDDFEVVTKNLIIMAMHEGSTGQVMHFMPQKEGFAVLQLSIPKDIPEGALEEVIAHELGHVMQRKNWEERDGNSLEDDADKWAKRWGFCIKDSNLKWLEAERRVPKKGQRF